MSHSFPKNALRDTFLLFIEIEREREVKSQVNDESISENRNGINKLLLATTTSHHAVTSLCVGILRQLVTPVLLHVAKQA
jgi:hypothetical protein